MTTGFPPRAAADRAGQAALSQRRGFAPTMRALAAPHQGRIEHLVPEGKGRRFTPAGYRTLWCSIRIAGSGSPNPCAPPYGAHSARPASASWPRFTTCSFPSTRRTSILPRCLLIRYLALTFRARLMRNGFIRGSILWYAMR